MKSGILVLVLAITAASQFPAAADAAERVPVPAFATDMTFTSLRGVIYCEVQPIGATSEAGLAVYVFNTSNLNNSTDKMTTCPADMWAKVDADALKSKYGVVAVFKNGPRGWTMDTVTTPVGPVVDFGGLKTRWWATVILPKGISYEEGVAGALAYRPLQSHRKSTFTFQAGEPVFILQDPAGTPWVMQAFSRIVDPSVTYDSLKNLGARLKLSNGWTYRVAVLQKDLRITTPRGYNWIIQDDLRNTYDACKEGACNYQP